MSAKVSILVPVYNVEPYLRECLESIRRQTLQEIEIVCVNDGSTDQSLKILQEYQQQDPRFKVISQENGGYGKAMNTATNYATGEYIGIVEPDDFVHLSMFEDLYKAASANYLDFVKSDFYRFTRDEKGNMKLTYNQLDSSGENYDTILDPSHSPHIAQFNMNTWCGIYRREFLEDYKIRYHETPGAAFQDNGFFWQTTIYAQRAMFLRQPYYMNRRDNPNSSVNSREKVYCMNEEYDYIRKILLKDETIWERFKYVYTLKKFHNYIFTFNRISAAYKKEYIQVISDDFKAAEQRRELSQIYFTAAEWDKLLLLMRDTEGFFYKFAICSSRDANYYKERLYAVENSTTFKVGRVIMCIPCALKEWLLKRKR